jgi:hypothetical protein
MRAFAFVATSDGEAPVPIAGTTDGQLDQGVATQHGPVLPFDCFNFDRRPGEVFRRL